MDEPIRVRIITVGDVRSGKSATIKKYCEPTRFVSKHIPTVGVDYGVKSTTKNMSDGSTDIKIDFFDLSGEKTCIIKDIQKYDSYIVITLDNPKF